MYKPGNMSAPPSVVTPHQPRLDWQMWFAALGTHTQAPWFTSLMYRLLQGKRDGRVLQFILLLCFLFNSLKGNSAQSNLKTTTAAFYGFKLSRMHFSPQTSSDVRAGVLPLSAY